MTDAPASVVGDSPSLEVALEREPGSAYLLSPALCLTYVNEGWRRFARENGGPELATPLDCRQSVLDVVAAPLQSFYRAAFARVLAGGEAWTHTYECSSAEVFRKFNMRVESNPHGEGLVVIHSLVVETPFDRVDGDPPIVGDYTNLQGLIVQCANCRRVKRSYVPERWDCVPSFVVHASEYAVTHGLCPGCDALYYPS